MTIKAEVGDVVMYDHAITPAPKHKLVLCGSTELGTTVKGIFDERFHDCWFPLPKHPQSCKERLKLRKIR